jgi:hypothetical protein
VGKRIRNLWRALLLEWDGRSSLLYRIFAQKSIYLWDKKPLHQRMKRSMNEVR